MNRALLVRSAFGTAVVSMATLLLVGCKSMQSQPLLFGQENAAWSRAIFFRGHSPTTGEPLKPQEVDDFANTLRDNNVKYVYIFSGPFDRQGKIPNYAFSDTAKNSMKRIKEIYPEIKILPWIGGLEGQHVFVSDPLWRQGAIETAERLLAETPLDGIHYDFEFLVDKGGTEGPNEPQAEREYVENLLLFHKEARARLKGKFISSVLPSSAPQTRPWKKKFNQARIQQLAPLVDQLSFLYYDTAINDKSVFENGLKAQLEDIEKTRNALGSKSPQILLAVGTFINEPALHSYRNLEIESIPATLSLFRNGLAQSSYNGTLVDGLAIYCEWLTEADEWRDIRDGWTKQSGARSPE